MLKKNYPIIIAITLLLTAGVMADIFFWKHISIDNQRQQDRWQTRLDALSEKIDQQQTDLSALKTKVERLTRLNNAPSADTAHFLLELQTLSESISQLTFIPQNAMPLPIKGAENASEKAQPWYRRLLQALWISFKSLFSIHYNNAAPPTVSPPNQREWIRENIFFTLAEAQWAVLQQKPDLYQHSLVLVREWLMNEYPDSAQRKEILDRLAKLMTLEIAPPMQPDTRTPTRMPPPESSPVQPSTGVEI